jgi:hypothetical protein
MSPPPPLHYSSRVTPSTYSNLKKRAQNDEQPLQSYDSFLIPGKEEEVEDRDTDQCLSVPGKSSSSSLMDYGAVSDDDESLSWDSGFKNLDDYYNNICVLETEMTLQLLPSQMFACLKQSSSSSSSQAYSYHNARGGGILIPAPQSIAQNYAYSIDPFFKEPQSSPSPSCSPPSSRTFNPSRQSQKMPLYRQKMEEVLFKLDEDQFIELHERNHVGTKTHQQKIAKESPDEMERVKLQVVVEPKENNSSENSEKETKGRRPKRRKILWKRMNPTLFQEIFQWETNQPKVKQSQIEKKFNVNRSTYYRWKKKYLAQ